jgi:endonuclease III-like uncharacterized protein
VQKNKYYDPWTDLVIAILSTAGYSLEKTYQHVDGLKNNGITDPMHLASLTKESIAKKLVASGYNRGIALTAIYTDRLFSMRTLSEKLEDNTKIISTGSFDDIKKLLVGIKGVGPYVIESFLVLRGDFDKRA